VWKVWNPALVRALAGGLLVIRRGRRPGFATTAKPFYSPTYSLANDAGHGIACYVSVGDARLAGLVIRAPVGTGGIGVVEPIIARLSVLPLPLRDGGTWQERRHRGSDARYLTGGSGKADAP
jgi:hypothetical protein